MITISLWQPWASAIAVGLKKIETRSWPAECVGQRIAIHAAKRDTREQREWWMKNVKAPHDVGERNAAAFAVCGIHHWADLPFGAVVCTADLVQVETTEHLMAQRWVIKDSTEFLWGNYSRIDEEKQRPRYGWWLRDVRALTHPFACVGRQGFFMSNVPTA